MKRLLLASLMLLSTAAFAHSPNHKVFEDIRSRTVLVAAESLVTGIVIEDGKVLTVGHLTGTERIVMSRPRKMLRRSLLYDLMLLEVPELKGKTELGPPPEITDNVFLIGFTPNVRGITFVSGYVFHVNEVYILVDAPSFPGNSGAGVYNEKGQLVGTLKGVTLFCETYCRPMAVVKSVNIIKVFLRQGGWNESD